MVIDECSKRWHLNRGQVSTWEKLKAFHPRKFGGYRLKKRRVVSGILFVLGVVLLMWGVFQWLFSSVFTIDDTVLMMCGAVLVVVGILILIADLFETFLSHGQTALVDGLQAG